MTRIVIFSTFYDPFMSGAERMVKEVVERLQDRYSFIIVTARLDKNQESRIKNYGNKNIEVVRVGFGAKYDKFLYPLLAPFYALKYKPKVVHAVMESYAGIALLIFAYILKFLKLIIHNSSFLILTLQSGDLDLTEKQARIPYWLWKKIHCTPNLVVSIGNSMALRARALGAKNVMVIPNGVDLLAAEKVTAKNIQKELHRIVCVARLSSEKGLEYLIDAMSHIVNDFSDAKLVLVGDGALHDKLQAYSDKLQVYVEFKGNLPHEVAMREVARGEVFVLPSLAEGMGIVLVEAQALGVPVVGTEVGGIPDVIEHEKTGLLVPARDPEAIAKAVKRIFTDTTLAADMVQEAKKRLAKFDWQNIAEEYREIYEQLHE